MLSHRERLDRRLQRLGVLGGKCAHRVLDAVPELAEYNVRDVSRKLRDEEHTDALGADQPDGLGDRLQKTLAGICKQQMRLVEEERQGRCLRIADLGELFEQLGQHPHQERREERGFGGDGRKRHYGDDAFAVGGGAEKVPHVEPGFTEEHVAALALELGDLTLQHPDGGARQTPQILEVGFARPDQVRERGTQVLQLDEWKAIVVAEPKDQAQARLLRLVERQHLGQQRRAELRERRADRRPVLAGQGHDVDRRRARRPHVVQPRRPCGDLVAGLARRADAGQVALHVGGKHRAARGCDLLGDQLQGLGLSGAGGAGDQPVAVDQAERDPDIDAVDRLLGIDERPAQVYGRAVEPVALRKISGEVPHQTSRRDASGASSAACPAAIRATWTRYGEHDT